MKRRSPILSAICALVIMAAPAGAQIIDTPAAHAVILDNATGEILFSKAGTEPMIPASMTKMMTAYLVFDMVKRGELKMTDRLTVSADAWRRGGFPSGTSTMGLVPKDTPTIEELLHGVIIMSGNDACIVLAEGISGSEEAFARRMTDLAHEKGYGLTGSAERDGVRRTIVINGMESMAARASEGERMLRLAFQSFELKTIAPESVSLPEQKVWLGQQGLVPVSLAEPMLIAGHKAAFENAKTEIVLDKALEAPVKKGDRVGRLVVTLEGRPPVEAPVIAEADVKKLGFFGKAVEGLSALINGG